MTLFGPRCLHSDCTPEDGEGYVICACCGATVRRRITREQLARPVPYSVGHYPFPRELGSSEDSEE
jgi:hypothetical protein